jgi:DNA-binding GntR family transcriptional regulator
MRHAAEQAADAIREDILAGRLPAGARIAEADVARQLSVSRTPIREALSRLAAEGLVELSPNRGARVTTWSAAELREIFDVRLRLEPYSVRQAVPILTDAQLGDLSGRAEAMLAAGRPDGPQDLETIIALNRRFHGLLVDAAGNAALAASLTAVTHAAVVHQNFQHYTPGALARSLAHHAEIVAAARAREPAWAEAVMRSHLFNARATMLGDTVRDDTGEVPS